jgi:hypothetical protein
MTSTQALHDRLHRAKSWINAANVLSSDQKHAQFVFSYIALNALSGRRQYEGSRDQAAEDRQDFLRRVKTMSDYDRRYGKHTLLKALEARRKECGDLITNHFLRDSYWRKEKTSKQLRDEFIKVRQRADDQLSRGRYDEYVDLVLRRLGVLRNQIVHGCVTYGPSSKGLPSLEAGLAVLREIVPAFYELMDKYGHNVSCPPIPYPRVGSEAHPKVDELQ